MRCAWKGRPSTMKVISLTVSELTYSSPRLTLFGFGCGGRCGGAASAVADSARSASRASALAAFTCSVALRETTMSSSASMAPCSSKTLWKSSSLTRYASATAVRWRTSSLPQRKKYRRWRNTRFSAPVGGRSLSSRRLSVLLTQSLEACTMSSPSLRRCTAPSRTISATLSGFSASPYSAKAALCCKLGERSSSSSSSGLRPPSWQMPAWLSAFCARRPSAKAAISLSSLFLARSILMSGLSPPRCTILTLRSVLSCGAGSLASYGFANWPISSAASRWLSVHLLESRLMIGCSAFSASTRFLIAWLLCTRLPTTPTAS
mmetsp:Transcript_17599/g.54613  ORF Transcript_17599/g.54613 Transcript_17599/m.54613 type:complete len:320 (+) Transcript_17599:277-1236(+)